MNNFQDILFLISLLGGIFSLEDFDLSTIEAILGPNFGPKLSQIEAVANLYEQYPLSFEKFAALEFSDSYEPIEVSINDLEFLLDLKNLSVVLSKPVALIYKGSLIILM